MEWSEVVPDPRFGRALKAEVRANAKHAVVSVTFHVTAFERCAVLDATRVKVLRGTDGPRQVLRLELGGSHPFGRAGGRAAGQRRRLVLARPAWFRAPAMRLSSVCEFDYGDDWIEVELPDWFKAPAAIPTPAPVARAPFVPLIPNQPRGVKPGRGT